MGKHLDFKVVISNQQFTLGRNQGWKLLNFTRMNLLVQAIECELLALSL